MTVHRPPLDASASDDDRFARLGDQTRPTLLTALAAQPGCPPAVRFAALLQAHGDIIDAHCAVTGDDRGHALRMLWDRLHEAAQ